VRESLDPNELDEVKNSITLAGTYSAQPTPRGGKRPESLF
jgi:hypothetical protein